MEGLLVEQGQEDCYVLFLCFVLAELKPFSFRSQLATSGKILVTEGLVSSLLLRSTGKPLLDHPKRKMLSTLGARSFSAAALKLWNGLPVELRQATSLDCFKPRLKTYLFKKYFYN